jgi:hypothetical protein
MDEQLTMAPLPWAHLAQLMLHTRPHPAQVNRSDPIEDLGRLVGDITGRNHNAGVIERHIQPAERINGRLHHGRHAVLVGHITTNTKNPVTSGCQLVYGRTKGGLIDVSEDHRSPGLGERTCGGKAHA